MPDLNSYDYAYVRVTPSQARGEFINVGVILFCRTLSFLEARIVLDEERVRMLDPTIDISELRRHLETVPQVCAGDGPIGALGQAESFHWLVAPHNTVVHASPVHSGFCRDPRDALARLIESIRCGSA